MPQIVVAMAQAYKRQDLAAIHSLLLQGAAKIGDSRGQLIRDLLAGAAGDAAPQTLRKLPANTTKTGAWHPVKQARAPFVPTTIAGQLATWAREMRHAEALIANGEQVRPLLLVGPPRCGKTTSAARLASELGRTAYRLNSAEMLASYMGESAKNLRKALDDAAWLGDALCLIDEVDGLMPRRSGGTSAQDQERAHTLGCLLTWLEELPPRLALVATTNRLDAVDPAIAARMTVIEWPVWEHLSEADRRLFCESHGCTARRPFDGYADVVALARAERVERILHAATDGVGTYVRDGVAT